MLNVEKVNDILVFRYCQDVKVCVCVFYIRGQVIDKMIYERLHDKNHRHYNDYSLVYNENILFLWELWI